MSPEGHTHLQEDLKKSSSPVVRAGFAHSVTSTRRSEGDIPPAYARAQKSCSAVGSVIHQNYCTAQAVVLWTAGPWVEANLIRLRLKALNQHKPGINTGGVLLNSCLVLLLRFRHSVFK